MASAVETKDEKEKVEKMCWKALEDFIAKLDENAIIAALPI